MSLNSYNSSKTFPLCPAASDQPLPFTIDEMDFSTWLSTLSSSDDNTKCQKIFQVLQTLNSAYPPHRMIIPGRTRLFFLDKLGAVLTTSAGILTNFPGTTDVATQTVAKEDMGKSEISAWSSIELARAYTLLTQENWFRENDYYSLNEKTSIIANGLHALGRGLLYIHQTYSRPHADFWVMCCQFYRLAQSQLLIDSTFNPEASNAIENAFKRILVFTLSNPNQFSPHEMSIIYAMLGHYAVHASLLKSVPKKKFKGIPSIHLKNGHPPIISDDSTEHHDPDCIYIATVVVASKILEATYDKRARYLPTDRLMLLRLAKTLTLNEQRKDDRKLAQGGHYGTVGFDNIVKLIQNKETEQKNSAFNPTSSGFSVRPGEIRDLNFEIVSTDNKKPNPAKQTLNLQNDPDGAFKVVEFTDPASIWNTSAQPQIETSMRLVDKSLKGYGLIWTDIQIKPKVGSIIGIMSGVLNVGLIRWLAQSKETGMFMGVELLGSRADSVKIYNPGYPDDEVNAIFLPGNDALSQSASLIIINKVFKPNEFIFIRKGHKNIRYRIVKQLHLTSFINHFEIIRSH